MTQVIRGCQGTARFDTLDQAEYIRADTQRMDELEGEWEVVACYDHFHVMEKQPPKNIRVKKSAHSSCKASIALHGVGAKCERKTKDHKLHRGLVKIFESAPPCGWSPAKIEAYMEWEDSEGWKS